MKDNYEKIRKYLFETKVTRNEEGENIWQNQESFVIPSVKKNDAEM